MRVKKVKGVNVGDSVPVAPKSHETVGKFIEDQLKSYGHNYNDGKGIDLPDLRTENKVRKRSSRSAHTVGRMTTDDIINTSWEDSSVREKILANQNRYVWDDTFCEVIENTVYDFSDPFIEEKLKEGYELGRAEIASGTFSNNTKTYGPVIWQKDKGKEQWQYRITDKGMKDLTGIARQKTFNNLFDFSVDNSTI